MRKGHAAIPIKTVPHLPEKRPLINGLITNMNIGLYLWTCNDALKCLTDNCAGWGALFLPMGIERIGMIGYVYGHKIRMDVTEDLRVV